MIQHHLASICDEVAARRRNANVLREILAADGFWTLPALLADAEPVYHLLSLLAPKGLTAEQRHIVIDYLNANGITAFTYLPAPIPALPKMAVTVDEPPLFWFSAIAASWF